MLKRALISQIGGFFRDAATDTLVETAVDQLADNLTPIVDAVHLTTKALRSYTPIDLIPHLEELVYYFAERGHANLSHLHSDAARDPDLLARGLNATQIRAVANAVLGNRPHHGERSLLGAFLLDESFEPHDSPSHSLALNKYAARLSAMNIARELVAA